MINYDFWNVFPELNLCHYDTAKTVKQRQPKHYEISSFPLVSAAMYGKSDIIQIRIDQIRKTRKYIFLVIWA